MGVNVAISAVDVVDDKFEAATSALQSTVNSQQLNSRQSIRDELAEQGGDQRTSVGPSTGDCCRTWR